MAGQKFEYDESGGTFFYFLISVLGLILVPCTFYIWPAENQQEPKPEEKKDRCQCPECIKKEERLKFRESKWKGTKKHFQRVLIVLGWIAVAALVYKVQQFDYEYANFDPYDILGVSLQASSADIKKAYRKLSLVYHPDKPTGDEKKFMKLNKAYQALTDPIARRNYEMYGNPDGPGAMNFGIALPSWIVEKENSFWVLGLYTLVFMIGLPTVVAIWWYRSSKFSSDQVLLDTTQMFFYLYHKTPSMVYKRALMVLSASFEYEKSHNSAIVERPSDNYEVPSLFKHLPHINEKSKEKPLCFAYSVKARVLLHAHLSRLPLNPETLDKDRLYILHCVPTLVQEMVSCVAQLTMLVHAGRLSRMPTLDTLECTMKLCPTLIQALWDTKSALLQLPHFDETMLRNCVVRGRQLRTVQQLIAASPADRRHVLRFLEPEEQMNVLRVLAIFPHVTMEVNCEVVDDDDSGVFTAGAIVTVTVLIKRQNSGDVYAILPNGDESIQNLGDGEKKSKESAKEDDIETLAALAAVDKKKTKWSKAQKQKATKSTSHNNKNVKENVAKRKGNKTENKSDLKTGDKDAKKVAGKKEAKKDKKKENEAEKRPEDGEDSDEDASRSHSDESEAGDADTESHKEDKPSDPDEDDDAEWEKCQRGLNKREKVLEGKSKISHSVHCPYYPDDKQEYWWIYICDRKNHRLITVPYYVTDLVTQTEVQLKLTAPPKPGVHTYTVCLRSDSYVGVEVLRDIKMDVKAAREVPTQHPQWEECSSEEEEDSEDEGDSNADHHKGDVSEFTTDEESDEVNQSENDED